MASVPWRLPNIGQYLFTSINIPSLVLACLTQAVDGDPKPFFPVVRLQVI